VAARFAEVRAAVERLDPADLAEERWFGAKGRPVDGLELVEAFDLNAEGSAVLAIVGVRTRKAITARYSVMLGGDAEDPGPATPGDGSWRTLAAAIAEGRTIPAIARPGPAGAADLGSGPVTAALVCRPARALERLVDDPAAVARLEERALGADQSNTSVVLGERLLLKAYRRIETGLNPELELVAYLSEEADFPAVPPLAGYAEVVSAKDGLATVAILQAFVAGASDAYESIAETLAAWLLAPGSVSVEYATEVAADLGTLTAALHTTLATAAAAPDFAPREATREELRRWSAEARTQFDQAVEVTSGEAHRTLRDLGASIAAELTVFEALAATPVVTRVHGDLHLGQVLIADDGYRIIDFEGEPTRPIEDRRAHRSPLRDVASMLRSIDHVGRSARRRAEIRNGGPLEAPGLDIEAWLVRARERFLGSYRAGIRHGGGRVTVDPDLLRAFEIEKECYEFIYAATYLPEWSWAPTEGMRGLFATDRDDSR
jgi:trehalose synthase-fused probable maltokinase